MNPRYFADTTGRVLLLTGAHTWNSLQDSGPHHPPSKFEFDAFVRDLVARGHNFFRLWTWEQGSGSADSDGPYFFAPSPYLRTGPGLAADELPRFDLSRFDPLYFDRLRARVERARAAGLYVSVMLFNGWSLDDKNRGLGNPWRGHPFNGTNNVNSIDGDSNADGEGTETHSLGDQALLRLQERYVRRVVELLNDMDNVLYEVSNESPGGSAEWQYRTIRLIREIEKDLPRQHPVGMTVEWPDGSNEALWGSPADWVSPNGRPGGLREPPVADGRKVIIDDTDHLCGICGDSDWAWRSFTRGRNPIYMDVYDGDFSLPDNERIDPRAPEVERLRRNLGYLRAYSLRLDLGRATPRPDMCSSGFCLVATNPGVAELIVYQPEHGSVTVDLRTMSGDLEIEWFSPRFELVRWGGRVHAGARRKLRPPFLWGPAVAYLRQTSDRD